MQKITILKNLFFGLFFIVLLNGQLNAQIVIGQPTFVGWDKVCASEDFNSYGVRFTFTEGAVTAATVFKIELSDADGNFTDATTVATSAAGSITVSPGTLNFEVPVTTSGEGYKVRVKSESPVGTSSNSVAFPAYYKIHDDPFSINSLVETGAFCSGGSYILAIDEEGVGLDNSPLVHSSLTFNWFRVTGPTTSELVAQGSEATPNFTLNVNQVGKYYAETNYGSCGPGLSFSNRVEISEVDSGTVATVFSSLGNPFCSADGATTLTTISGVGYQWYKDGATIEGATDQTYETNESGTFSVAVDLGGCNANGSIDLDSGDFSSSIDASDVNTIDIASGETLTVTVTTTATSPEYDWYLNGNLISGANGSTYEATEEGNYKVVISQTTGCMVSREFLFAVEVPVDPFPNVENIPNLISPNGDGINDTWIIPTEYVSGTDTEVIVMTNRGEVVLKTNDYQNNWPEDELNLTNINLVYYYMITAPNQEPKKGSITIVK